MITTEKIKVLVVDDDPLALQTLSLYFSRTEDFQVVATARSGAEAIQNLQQTQIDVMLVDIHMPGMNGLTLQQKIAQMPHQPVFLAITSIDNDEYVMQTLRCGGAGYMLKSQRPESIVQATRDAVRGGIVVSPNSSIVKKISALAEEKTEKVSALQQILHEDSAYSCGEKQIITLLCEGLSNTEIANRLHYSESAIKKKVSKLIHEFDATSRLDLVVKLLNPR